MLTLSRVVTGSLALATVLCGMPTPGHAAAIVTLDSRHIQGSVRASPFDGSSPLSDSFDQLPPFGVPWAATDTRTVYGTGASATTSVSQTSTAGPLSFTAVGFGDSSGRGDGRFEAYGISQYKVGFELTTPYSYMWNATVNATVAGGGLKYGSAASYLYSSTSGIIIPSSYVEASTGVPGSFIDTSSTNGLLTPGSYYIFAFGQSDVDATGLATASGAYSLDLILTPASTAVPEPATLALMGAGLATLLGVRRRRSANVDAAPLNP